MSGDSSFMGAIEAELSAPADRTADEITLVARPYLELFAPSARPGWTAWGNETGKFEVAA